MHSIRLTEGQHGRVRGHVLAGDSEGAAFLAAGLFENSGGTHFVAREVLLPGDGDYEDRSGSGLTVSPAFLNRAIARASAEGLTLVACHSHPSRGARLEYSGLDDRGERLSSETVRGCLGGPMGSLLLGPGGTVGRAWIRAGAGPERAEVRLVGRRLEVRGAPAAAARADPAVYDRQIRAFGESGQSDLSRLHVGVVGAGGIGSAVAEQLARAGVCRFTVVDHDRFSPSNVTRVYGSHAGTGPEYKVDIARRNIERIRPGASVRALACSVVSQDALASLKECDVVFGCVDRGAPRSVLNELAHQYFIPVIDAGVGIVASGGAVSEVGVRISLSSPSVPCLYCVGAVRPDAVLAESLGGEDLARRAEQGYVQAAPAEAPSVVPVTTMASSCAVLVLLDLLFGVLKTESGSVVLDATTFQSVRMSASPKDGCVCSKRAGMGDSLPLSAPPGRGRPPAGRQGGRAPEASPGVEL